MAKHRATHHVSNVPLVLALVLGALLPTVVRPVPASASDCSNTSVGLTPIMDLGSGRYQSAKGGLYPDGVDFRPVAHERAGESIAEDIQPLGRNGSPDPQGKYALLSIGMSNATIEFRAFRELVRPQSGLDPHLVLVDGAQNGVTAARWADPKDHAWATIQSRLSMLGLTSDQVVGAWVKVADSHPTSGWPNYAKTLEGEMATIARNLHLKFPNLRIAFYSSRSYAGYSTTRLNPEPYAYQSGFAVKWVVRDQIDGSAALNFDPSRGTVLAPWISWGPYLWADGTHPRSDGLAWRCSDFLADGTHPSKSGASKVANLLQMFFENDSTARPWFLATPPSAKHARHATVAISASSVATGVVTVPDGFGACTQQADVVIQRHKDGKWVGVATATTGKRGHFHAAIPDASGSYRARLPGYRLAGPGSDVCKLATSVPQAA
jgi:hypothetical protein